MNKISYFDLFKYSLSVGVNAISKGIITKESIKRIACPMDVSRYYELQVVANNLRFMKRSRILDVSSPKLLTYYLANKFKNVNFYGIDKFIPELDSWKLINSASRNLKIEYGDATKLKYPSNYFDEIYSVSVIEHLGNKNVRDDIKMMKEVYRVLKKGGRFYMTTPISINNRIVYKNIKYYDHMENKNTRSFFCRIYSYKEIMNKLVASTKFTVVNEEICNYKFYKYESAFNKFMPISVFLMGWINLLICPKMIQVSSKFKSIGYNAEYFACLEK